MVGRCSFVSKEGRRCDSTHRLEYDHIIPRAVGGKSTEDNIRMLCRSHNAHAAAEVLGRQRVENAKAVAILARDCRSALVNMGYSKAKAKAAVAALTISAEQSIGEVVRAGLQAVRHSG